jgi:hypothetical protein
MGDRFWTLDEANAALPRVTVIIEEARAAVASLRSGAEQTMTRAKGNGHSPPGNERAVLAAAVARLADDGIVVRDIDQGLVDFPALAPSGRTYWLCWVVGEAQVSWWHWPEDGFAGRTALDTPPP